MSLEYAFVVAGLAVSAPALLSTREVATLAGVSLRQIQIWDERGLVVAGIGEGSGGGAGHPRVYDRRAALTAFAIATLRRKRFPLKRVRGVVAFLKRDLAAALEESDSGMVYLLIDADGEWLLDDPRGVVACAEAAVGGVYLVALDG